MFYLTGRNGAFLAGYVHPVERGFVFLEGTESKGVTKKFEASALSKEDAWDYLCEQVVAARADGYVDGDLVDAKVARDAESYQGVFPVELRGVYAHVDECNEHHFRAGASRLEEVTKLSSAHIGVEAQIFDRFIRIKIGKHSIEFGLADLLSWNSMSSKGRELCEEKGFVDSSKLLPSGKGLWHFKSEETVLDVCVRAFLAGAISAGARIRLSADAAWRFTEEAPFHLGDVKDLAWATAFPKLQIQLANNVSVAPAMSDEAFAETFMFF